MEDEIQSSEWLKVGKGPLITSTFRPREAKIDPEISKIVGRKVFVNDPKLIKLVSEYKRNKDPDKRDDFLRNEAFIKDVKKIFQ